jgi:hypothetical protein
VLVVCFQLSVVDFKLFVLSRFSETEKPITASTRANLENLLAPIWICCMLLYMPAKIQLGTSTLCGSPAELK